MKKALVILVVLVFAACLWIGFDAASKLANGSGGLTVLARNTSPLPAQQHNLLLVHTTSLDHSQAKLVSVWAAYISFTNPPQMILMPLYPQAGGDRPAFATQTVLDSENRVSDKFIKSVQETYALPFTGYALVDSEGVQAFNKWFLNQEITLDANIISDPTLQSQVLNASQQFFTHTCALFEKGDYNPLSKIRWSSILPDHFRTNLSFETLTLDLEKIVRTSDPVSCRVILPEK